MQASLFDNPFESEDAGFPVAGETGVHGLNVSVADFADMLTRVVARYDEETMTLHRPKRLGGTLTLPMSAYDDFDGGLKDWVESVAKKEAEGI